MPTSEKVVALITRAGDSGVEVCVFEHPSAGVQLPAGTLHPGEDPVAGAIREGFEETGLDDVDVTGELLVIPASDDAPRRHIVHMTQRGPSPREWWVFTPDGDGLVWRCFWLPIHEIHILDPAQQFWLREAMPHLARIQHNTALHREVIDPDSDLTVEFFFAPPLPGERIQISWLEPSHPVLDQDIGRTEVLAFTEEGLLVTVGERGSDVLGLPGGHREPGESLEQTLRRELYEEACAEVVEEELLGYQRFRHVENDRFTRVSTDAMYWARATCAEFVPRFEMAIRRLLPVVEARQLLSWKHPLAGRQLDRAVAAESRHPS